MLGWLLAAALALPASPAEAAMPAPSEVMAVPSDLHAMLQARVLDQGTTRTQRLRLLARMMSGDKDGLNMQYRDDATQTVAQGFATRQANCLTYTMMFLALAQEAGLQAQPQEINETLSWQQRDGIVYRSNHVNASISIGRDRYLVDVGSSFVIGRRPARPISHDRLLAQYYNNRAAQLLAEGDLRAALAHTRVSIALDPGYPTTWSNTGVVRLRSGDKTGAEQAYLRALELQPSNSGALFNLAGFYQRNGDRAREQQVRRRLEKLQTVDPFHHFLRGVEFERQGDGLNAAASYRRAIALHRDEHRFHYRLARAYLLTGDLRRARIALQKALDLCKDEVQRAQYQAALLAISANPS